jgi:hypothetical protein
MIDDTEACKSLVRLVNDLRSKGVKLEEYTDEKWCEDYTDDEYFLYVLCWAGWRVKRQESVWKGVRDSYINIGKSLHEFTPADTEKLCNSYQLDWQRNWLRRIVDFLVNTSTPIPARNFVLSLRKSGYEHARSQLQGIVKTSEETIVDKWLRDVVKIDAFPIDSRIRNLLKKYGIPADSNLVIKCCKQNNIPVRPFARAVYANAEVIDKLS